MAAPCFAFICRDSDNIIWMLLHQIRVEIVQREAHIFGVFLVNAKYDGLVEPPVCFQKIGEIAGDGFGAWEERDFALKIFGSVFGIWNLASQTVKLAPIWSPTYGIGTRDDAMDAIRG